MASAEELGERGTVRAIITIRYCQRSPQFVVLSTKFVISFVTQSLALHPPLSFSFTSPLRSPLSLGDMLGAADERRRRATAAPVVRNLQHLLEQRTSGNTRRIRENPVTIFAGPFSRFKVFSRAKEAKV